MHMHIGRWTLVLLPVLLGQSQADVRNTADLHLDARAGAPGR